MVQIDCLASTNICLVVDRSMAAQEGQNLGTPGLLSLRWAGAALCSRAVREEEESGARRPGGTTLSATAWALRPGE